MFYTVSGIAFPLITFPYASRILLADGIGKLQFFNSIIGYIIFLTSIGIPLYAIRETAKVRDDKRQLSKTTTEILLLHAVFSAIGYMIVFILICTVAKIQADIPFFLLLSVSIFFTSIGVEWFYNGIEDFKYITIRSTIVRVLSLIALFIFVKEKDDLFYYAAINVIGTVGSNVFNFFRLRKYISLSCFRFRDLKIWRHFRPVLRIFSLNLIIGMSENFDIIMLGFLKNEAAVGYYAVSMRLARTLVSIATSLDIVLLPRLTNLAGNNKTEEFRLLSQKSIHFIMALSLPLSIGIIFMASPVIHLFCGDKYDPSIFTLQLIAPIIILTPISKIYCTQILYALGKEKLSIVAVSVGTVINFILNAILIPEYSQYGAGITIFISEFFVVIIAIMLGMKYVPFRIFSKEKIHYYVASAMIVFVLLLLKFTGMNEFTYLIVGTITAMAVYSAYLMTVKDEFILWMKTVIVKKIGIK